MSTAAPGIVRRGIGSDARHTEPVRQLIGKGKVFLVVTLPISSTSTFSNAARSSC